MGSGVFIKVDGLDKLIKKFGQIPENVKASVDFELQALSNEYEERVVAAAPVDQQSIRRDISSKKVGEMDYRVVSPAEHSAFLEFGTRSFVQVPSELQGYAAQFKGMKSSGDAKKAIFDWCKRKSIPEEAWYPIFRKIMTQGIHPHPFFFIHLPWAREEAKRLGAEAVKIALSK